MSVYVVATFHSSEAAGGLMAAGIVLIGIPSSLLGGYHADRANRLKAFIFLPLITLGLG